MDKKIEKKAKYNLGFSDIYMTFSVQKYNVINRASLQDFSVLQFSLACKLFFSKGMKKQ